MQINPLKKERKGKTAKNKRDEDNVFTPCSSDSFGWCRVLVKIFGFYDIQLCFYNPQFYFSDSNLNYFSNQRDTNTFLIATSLFLATPVENTLRHLIFLSQKTEKEGWSERQETQVERDPGGKPDGCSQKEGH